MDNSPNIFAQFLCVSQKCFYLDMDSKEIGKIFGLRQQQPNKHSTSLNPSFHGSFPQIQQYARQQTQFSQLYHDPQQNLIPGLLVQHGYINFPCQVHHNNLNFNSTSLF